MAEQLYTPEQRQDILRYRRLKTADTMQRVGAATGNAGRTIQGKDPLYEYTPPGADNLTEEQKANLRAKYAEVLAKLAQAEREATSSDLDLQGARAASNAEMFKALMGLHAAQYAASGGVEQEKVKAYQKFGEAAIEQETKAREAQRLSPKGGEAVMNFNQQVQEGGIKNAAEVLKNMEADMRGLMDNPAQTVAYVQNVENILHASGRPELADFSLEKALSGGLGGVEMDTTLAKSLNYMLSTGNAAYATQSALQKDGAVRRVEAAKELKKRAPYGSKELDQLADSSGLYLLEAPGATTAYVKAPPTDATPDEKRAYVEKASSGQATVDDTGVVVSKASPGQSMAYDAFVQSNPMVDQQGTRATGAPGPMLPSGSSSSRSGPTADTIASIRKLRENIELQVKNLDNVNQSPLEKARAEAVGALQVSASEVPEFRTEDFDTKLDSADEAVFQKWKAQYAPNDSGEDYDLRGAFKAGLAPDPQTGHWPDTFKKPNHETFSDESQYAKGKWSRFAGHWDGDNYIPAKQSSWFADAYAKNPDWALRAAGRTAAAEERKDTRGLRADRDASILKGETNAPLTEKGLAVVRSIPRAIGRGALTAVDGLRKDRQESVEGLSPGRDVAFRPSAVEMADEQDVAFRPSAVEMEDEQDVAFRPSAVEMEDDILAPDMEALAAERAAAEQNYTEEVEPLLDEAPAPPPSQQRAQLRGTTLTRINQATAGPDLEEAGSEVPRVPFQRQPFATPAPRKPVGEVTAGVDFESTGGDEKTRTGPASAADVGAAAAQAPTRASVLRGVGKALQDKPEEKAAPKDEVKFDTDMDSWRRFQKRVDALPPVNPALERLNAAKAAVRGMPAPGERPSTDLEDYQPLYETPTAAALRRRNRTLDGSVGQ